MWRSKITPRARWRAHHYCAANEAGTHGVGWSGLACRYINVFGVVRTFGITNDKHAAPLTPRGKFRIFRQNVTDPFTFVGTAMQAGIGQATNEFPAYGQGASGYAKRYGASIADFAIGEFMRTFAFPTLLREDLRYFREGGGQFQKASGPCARKCLRDAHRLRAHKPSIGPIPSDALLQEVSPLCTTPQKTAASDWYFQEQASVSCSALPGQFSPNLGLILNEGSPERRMRRNHYS